MRCAAAVGGLVVSVMVVVLLSVQACR
jgi:hypothetical protein